MDAIFANQLRCCARFSNRLKDHPNKKAYEAVVEVFLRYARACEEKDPAAICQVAVEFDKPDWPVKKAAALQAVQSVDPTLTTAVFPEALCRDFVPICRIMLSGKSDTDILRDMLAYLYRELANRNAKK